MLVLGIESSCDDTAAAVLDASGVRASVVASQLVHRKYGGVVPELASRAHQQHIVPVVEEALAEAGVARSDLEAVAVTYGPGLAGALLVGLSFAKAYAFALGVPLVGVNHLEGHVYSVRIPGALGEGVAAPPLPYLCLVVSGGHTVLVQVDEGFRHTVLATTRDDAAGEAFDKVGKMLDLGYPAGPVIDRLASEGDADFQRFPGVLQEPPEGHVASFSFSGLKTSVLYYLRDIPEASRAAFMERHLADLCASFQRPVTGALVSVVRDAVRATGIRHVALVGGVSANSGLRASAESAAEADGFALYVPPPRYCTDNAAMIAHTGAVKLAAGHRSALTLEAEPSLPLGI
jgi:N6-L-threonylcarbamoyladenine synthase